MNLTELIKLLSDLRYCAEWDGSPERYLARIDRAIRSVQMVGSGLGRRVSEELRRLRE